MTHIKDEFLRGVLMELSIKAAALVKNATLIGVVADVYFYESPTFGDEVDLLIVTNRGNAKHSLFYELPEVEEVEKYLSNAFRGNPADLLI